MLNFKKSIATLGATLMLLQGLPAMLQKNDKAEAATWKPSIQGVMSRQYPIVMGNQFSSGRIDATKVNWCAKNLDILVINKSGDLFADSGANSSLANQIHAINPNVKVLQYVNIMDVWQSQPTYTWMKNNNAFLYDDAGKVVHPYQSSYGTQRWAGDPLKTNWQDYYAKHCKDMVTQGMDGVFSDNW
ncbi:MAG: putative glycoside hydrolase, partial [Candidatus Gastranaerophilales bacterium]|nr:putative glycoside hydrolase [Candidatus Gastranaerophilales bacterium]